MDRRRIIGGNWKMNTTLPTAVDLAAAVSRQVGEDDTVETVLFPPFPNLDAVNQVIAGSTLQLGAQDLFWEDRGAYTGEVSPPMLLAVGCRWVLVGHSERRRLLGEGDDIVNKKLHAALRAGLLVTLAIGETREERRAGRTEPVLEEQLRGSLAGVTAEQMERIVIAYEPVWAIGTGDTATPDQARDAHACVRGVLREMFGPSVAGSTRIQYGGSVTAQNAAEILAEPGIDGALVGGASLKADEFAAIVRAAAQA
ncbi:MAG TPA: triose-phosphate isomerase [Chloroflexota bacterium]|nr:triose-phosphate isomerase [Chloroflexota bacterium]